MTYSVDFRKKVLAVRKRDALTIEQVAQRFFIGKATVMRWIGRLEPTQKRDTTARRIDMEALAQDVKDRPDAYQYERAQKFAVRQSAIFYALKRLNLSYKKNAVPPQKRPQGTRNLPQTGQKA